MLDTLSAQSNSTPNSKLEASSFKLESKLGGTEERALSLLGQGIAAESVAAALGVSASRISQLLSQEEFLEKVTTLRYQNLQQHNLRDSSYDSLEDFLLDRLKKCLPLMFRPSDILKAIQVINGAKRRGQGAPEQIINQQNIVNLVLPTQITQKFTTNVNNQVISAGDQNLLTMQAGTLLKRIESSSVSGKESSLVIEDKDFNGHIKPDTNET